MRSISSVSASRRASSTRSSAGTEAGRIGVELQSKYRTWEELAQAFEAGMLSWHQQRGVSDPQQTGRVQKNLPALRQQIWPQIPYDAALPRDD